MFNIIESEPQKKTTRFIRTIEIIGVFCFALLSAFFTIERSGQLDSVIYEYGSHEGIRTSDIWFDADIPKQKFLMTDSSFIGHGITSEHPVEPLLLFTVGSILTKVLGLTTIHAIRIFTAGIAGIFIIGMYVLLRLNDTRVLDSFIFTGLASVSSSAIFWLPVPEAFTLGSISIILALCMLLFQNKVRNPLLLHVFLNFSTFSMTATNWVVGFLSTIFSMKWYKALLAFVGSLILASLFWIIERIIFPYAQYFFTGSGKLSKFTYIPSFERMVDSIRVFFFHSVVIPEAKIVTISTELSRLSIQQSLFSYRSLFGYFALFFWILLLLSGVIISLKSVRKYTIYKVVWGSLIFFVLLHVVFGDETFLYSMHFLPLLILLASSGSKTKLRPFILAIASCATVFFLITNMAEFTASAEFLRNIAILVYG